MSIHIAVSALLFHLFGAMSMLLFLFVCERTQIVCSTVLHLFSVQNERKIETRRIPHRRNEVHGLQSVTISKLDKLKDEQRMSADLFTGQTKEFEFLCVCVHLSKLMFISFYG